MGAEMDRSRSGNMKYIRVEEQSSVKDSCEAGNNDTKNSLKTPSFKSVSPIGIEGERSALKTPSFSLARSPKEIKEHNDVAVAAVVDVAAKRFVRQKRRWKATVRALSSWFRKLSPATALKRARDCYVRSLGNFSSHVSASAAFGVAYGAGHNLDKLPPAWISGSNRYREETLEPDTRLSVAFKQSLKETHILQSLRTFSSVPQIPSSAASRLRRVSSARFYASSKCGMQPMPVCIYTISETS